MILNQDLFGQSLFQSISYSGSWKQSLAFDYVAGTTVSVQININAVIPLGTTVKIYAGEVADEYTELINGIKAPVLFISPVSGSANLYVKLLLESSQEGLTPVISSISVTVSQVTSLYTIATQVLSDGLLASNTPYLVDTELQKFPIPYASFNPVAHRFALGKIAEACGGVAYQDRTGKVRVDSGNKLSNNNTNVFTISDDRILDVASPITTIKNKISVESNPLIALTNQIVWTLEGDNVINNGEVKSYDIFYSDFDIVKDGYATISSTPSGATITDETHYSWGCRVEVTGSANGQIIVLNIYGQPIVVSGRTIVTRSDGDSIRSNGEQSLLINENNLIQSAEMAGLIADTVIDITAQARRDLELAWRGDPTLELGDRGLINDIEGYIIEQEFNFDGALSCTSRIRKA